MTIKTKTKKRTIKVVETVELLTDNFATLHARRAVDTPLGDFEVSFDNAFGDGGLYFDAPAAREAAEFFAKLAEIMETGTTADVDA